MAKRLSGSLNEFFLAKLDFLSSFLPWQITSFLFAKFLYDILGSFVIDDTAG